MPLQIAHLWYLELCYLHFWLKRNQRIAFCFQTLGCFMRSPFGLSSVSWWDPEKKATSLSSVAQICITSWKIHERKSHRNKDCFKSEWVETGFPSIKVFFFRDFHAPYVFNIDNGIAAALITSRWVPQRWGSFYICRDVRGARFVDVLPWKRWIYVHHCSSLLLLYWRKNNWNFWNCCFQSLLDQRVTTIRLTTVFSMQWL